MVLIFVLAVVGVYEYLSSTATIPAALASATYQSTTVYYSDGKTVLGTIGATNRQDLTFAQIPTMLQNSVVAAEDKGFWTEGGISPTGILRAAIHDMTSSGKNGGSTITQEFVRGYYDGVGTQQTASRKIKEIFIAQKLAQTKSKQWIITNYLNLIYLGENSYGVAAAAQTYFGVPVTKLTIAQDAVIAGIIQQPSTFPMLSNRAALKARWTYVLQQMVADKYITQAQMSTMTFPKMLTDKNGSATLGTSIKANSSDPWAPYLMAQVKTELIGADGVSQQQIETGGLRVVTTISRKMEVEMYKAVKENLTSASISNTQGATVTSLPPWALVGAELQDPKTGEIIAEYPGKGQGLTTKECDGACYDNTASQTREQVGSSFKPYVLSTAVKQGMNVQTSVLNTSPYLCVAPDQSATFSVPLPESQYTADSQGNNPSCLLPGGYPVENDGGEQIGKQVGQQSSGDNQGATYWSDNPQDALAASSNTGFTDLAHKVGTANIINMADQFGVDGSASGADFAHYAGGVGLALGIASLSVQEQTTMLSTISNNGQYHQAHLIKYWQNSTAGSAEQMPKVQMRTVLTAQQAGDVQYAMEATTMPGGTAYPNVTYGGQTPGMVVSKTGTTTSSKSGFFIGATTQYSLVVGMFVNNPNSKANANNSLAMLGGGGFGGFWPAKIWNTFAQAAFSSAPQMFPTNPSGAGTAWNMLGSVPKSKPTVTCMVNGKKKKVSGKACPTTQQSQPNCQYDPQTGQWDLCTADNGGQNGNGNGKGNGGGSTPSPNCSYDPQTGQFDLCDGGSSATPTPTCSYAGQTNCTGWTNTTPTSGGGTTGFSSSSSAGVPVVSGSTSGFALGGGLTVPAGTLLWARDSRRRRRKSGGRDTAQ
jgi:membrane peptidoglycan carboxypeptidase